MLALRHNHRNTSINPKRNTNKRVVFKTGDTDITINQTHSQLHLETYWSGSLKSKLFDSLEIVRTI
jgi:hypothetical protein